MQDQMEKAVEYVVGLMTDPEQLDQYAESPYDDVAVHLSDEGYDGIDPLQVLAEALSQTELDPGTQEQVMTSASAAASAAAAGGYGAASASASATAGAEGYSLDHWAQILGEGIKITIDDRDVYNNVDNSLHAGEVHGSIYQENYTDIQNVGDGSVAAGEDIYDSNVQAGDGIQATDSANVEGVVQGVNYGQVAGDEIDDSVLGDGNQYVDNENAHLTGATSFGEGDAYQDNSFNEEINVTESFKAEANDSFNYDEHSDDDYTHKVDVEYHEEAAHGYQEEQKYEYEEVTYEEADYGHDHHEDEVYD